MNRVQVCAVKGKLVPHPTKRFEYVGYAVCPDAREADFSVRNGRSYRLVEGGESVAETLRIRIALRRGDLTIAKPAKPAKPAKKKTTTAATKAEEKVGE